MKPNQSLVDRTIRVVLGLALVAAIFYYTPATAWVWVMAILAIILISTGLAGFCPIYSMLKISTKK